MSIDHTYTPGQLIERISTRERLPFAFYPCLIDGVAVSSEGVIRFWPADDCRPVDHTERDLEKVIAAKDAEIARLETERDQFAATSKKVEAENQRLREALESLDSAARNRENTVGDLLRLIETKAALREALEASHSMLSEVYYE